MKCAIQNYFSFTGLMLPGITKHSCPRWNADIYIVHHYMYTGERIEYISYVYSFSHGTITKMNKLSIDCVHASSVNNYV